MQTLDQAMQDMLRKGLISKQDAISRGSTRSCSARRPRQIVVMFTAKCLTLCAACGARFAQRCLEGIAWTLTISWT